jgi:hypothetical protein
MSANTDTKIEDQVTDVETSDSNRKTLHKTSGGEPTAGKVRRRAIRYFAAAMAGITAVIYFMIGFNVVSVLDTSTDQIFGIFAGIAYALGVFLLLVFDRRVVWILGAIFQVFVIFMYFNLASQRSPAYEVWGLLLRVPQLMSFVALVYLAARLPSARPASSPNNP